MNNLLFCIGEEAKTPYYVRNTETNVFCIEELCFLFARDPFLITSDLKDPALVAWIGTECALPLLAEKLRPLLAKDKPVKEFVDTILDGTGYLDPKERETVDEVLRRNEGLGEYERRMSQADYLFRHRRTEAAIEEYEAILELLSQADDPLRPKLFERIADAYAELFLFDVASRYYKRAYDLSGEERARFRWVFCLRMHYPDEKYLSFAAAHPELSDVFERLEQATVRAFSEFEGTEEYLHLSALSVYRDEGNTASYKEEAEKILRGLKEAYASMVMS